MTTAEMLASVEAQIRKDIPRLMELREGCLLIRNEKPNNELEKVEIVKINCVYNHIIQVKPIELLFSRNYVECQINSLFEVIGHDIMLNDVLEWIKKKQFFIDDLCVDTDGYLSLLDVVNGKFKCLKVNWNLSSPYLKNQSEELINFLYNLIK